MKWPVTFIIQMWSCAALPGHPIIRHTEGKSLCRFWGGTIEALLYLDWLCMLQICSYVQKDAASAPPLSAANAPPLSAANASPRSASPHCMQNPQVLSYSGCLIWHYAHQNPFVAVLLLQGVITSLGSHFTMQAAVWGAADICLGEWGANFF